MIRVRRLEKPAVLSREAARWTHDLCAARRRYYQELAGHGTSQPAHPRAKKSRYAHPEVKRRLERMFGSKCAYCESHVTAVSYQHVEHFHPQSVYPWLAYDWDNLLLACERCNSGYKGRQFPLLDGSQPREDREDPCLPRDDQGALVDPCRDDPASFFGFHGAVLTCRNRRAEQTRDVCGLNREDLKEHRELWLVVAVDTAVKAYQLAGQSGRSSERDEFRQRLKALLRPSMPYVAMTRARLEHLGIDPDTL